MSIAGRSVARRVLTTTVVLGLWFVAAAQPNEVDVRLPPELQEKCVAHDFNIPGQGFYISGSGFYISGSGFYVSGSAGGMVRGDITFTDPGLMYPNTTLEPQTVGDIMDAIGGPEGRGIFDLTMGNDVLLVVADDFAGDKFLLPDVLRDARASEVTLAYLASLADDREAEPQFSHGSLVMHHLNTAIAELRAFDPATDPDRPGVTIWTHMRTGHRLIVAGVDLGEFGPGSGLDERLVTEADVLASLREGVGRLETYEPEVTVVNMSWVLLPCATVKAFLDNIDSFQTFDDYVAGLDVFPDTAPFADVVSAMGRSTNADLASFFDSDEMPEVQFVAAAGNFALEYEMLPAAWPRVVGVAVSPETRDFPDRYSNAGDVHVPGEWVTFQTLNEAGELGPETILSYAGTSYASPLVALYVALDAAGTMVCAPSALSSPLVTAPSTPTPADVPLIQAIDSCK